MTTSLVAAIVGGRAGCARARGGDQRRRRPSRGRCAAASDGLPRPY